VTPIKKRNSNWTADLTPAHMTNVVLSDSKIFVTPPLSF
jgi:hypothetical protein